MEPGAIDRLLPPGAVHQGAALEAWPLKSRDLDEILAEPPAGSRRVVLVLDQLSDPHNVGAILRTAAAFGVTAVVVQDRHAPPQSGALAKAASGALDIIPYVEVVNIARALDELAERGFWRIALAGDGEPAWPRPCPSAMWRWCWARKAPASAAWCASIARPPPSSRSPGRWKASTSPTPPPSRFYELRR